MQTIIIRYVELIVGAEGEVIPTLVGTETYEGIIEALIPSMPRSKPGRDAHSVFLTKCFENIEHHSWRLENVTLEQHAAHGPAVYDVHVRRHDSSKEEFLHQTLKKNRATTTTKLLRQGTLIEVDYGFVQQTARASGELKSNKRYMDTVLDAEMHKRRLAVVVKVISKNLIQVAPVTSQPAADEDRTVFKLQQNTLDKMPRYKHSGKESHVICSMLESVSSQRVLPPTSYFKNTTGRNPNYSIALSRGEIRVLKTCLVHAIGASDHVPFNQVLLERKSSQDAEARIAKLAEQLSAAQAKADELMVVARIAKRWSEELGRDFVEEVGFQNELDLENGLGPLGTMPK